MAALQYVDVPGYAALLLRRTYSDLALPGAIMDRSHEWLEGKDVHWSDEKRPGPSQAVPHSPSGTSKAPGINTDINHPSSNFVALTNCHSLKKINTFTYTRVSED